MPSYFPLALLQTRYQNISFQCLCEMAVTPVTVTSCSLLAVR